jgi:dTDP-4-amino-4,6-dideoxygalactose transaminase
LLRLTTPGADFGHSYYKYYAFVRPEGLRVGWTRDRIISMLQAEGIPCGTGTCPEIYLERAFESCETAPQTRHLIAQELGETSLMFLVHPTLSEVEMHTMAAAIERIIREATAYSAGARLKAA